MFTVDITLPGDVTPVFPNRCIHSDVEPADDVVTIKASKTNVLGLFLPFVQFGGPKVELQVPIRREHKAAFRRQREGRALLAFVLLLFGIFVVYPHFDGGGFERWIAVLLACLFLIPALVVELVWPRSFDVTHHGEKVDYEFKSKDYALRFAVLNHDHVLDIEMPGEEDADEV